MKSVAAIFLVALVSGALLLRVDIDGGSMVKQYQNRDVAFNQTSSAASDSRRCNLFSGEWVYDDVSQPLYEEGKCSFQQKEEFDGFACEKHGRKDLEFQKWRWQPHHCHLPRFDGAVFMEKIRGKRVVFVGDSLNRNQWISMLCLIESSLDENLDKSIIINDNLMVFKATEYNATVEFYWSPLLVESNGDDPFFHTTSIERKVRFKSIENHAKHWNDADILIFDAFMWFLEPNMTFLWGSLYKRVETRQRRFEMVLSTWSDWLEININRAKTKLFFMSLSPFHFHGEAWGDGCSCNNQSRPVSKAGFRGIATDVDMMQVVETALQKLETRGLNITYLNITHLSDGRMDAHPSIYKKHYHNLTQHQLSNPISYTDCIHWCLPGVPDVWNQILYSYILDSSNLYYS